VNEEALSHWGGGRAVAPKTHTGFVYTRVLRGGVQGSALLGGPVILRTVFENHNEFRISNYLWNVLHLPTDLTRYMCFKWGFSPVCSSFYCFM